MGNEIEKFDPSTMMEGVKDRIKATFASLIPDEAWSKMVETTVNDYFHKKESAYNYNRDTLTRFEQLVINLVKEETEKKTREYLASEGFTTVWSGYGRPLIGEKIKELLIDNAGLIFTNSISGMFQLMLNNFSEQIRAKSY